jgi:hypothetical protein
MVRLTVQINRLYASLQTPAAAVKQQLLNGKDQTATIKKQQLKNNNQTTIKQQQ